jgi:ABC-type glutathione transport system ATPase component
MSELTFDNVSVRYGSRRRGSTVVDGVNLSVASGTVVGLVGESGSGKSTLARAAVGRFPCRAGRSFSTGGRCRNARRCRWSSRTRIPRSTRA